MTEPIVTSLLGDCIAAIEEARMHNYSVMAAVQAAQDHLELAGHVEAVAVASILAGWIATDLNPTVTLTNLEEWVKNAALLVADQGPT